jgi:hypothetical protein
MLVHSAELFFGGFRPSAFGLVIAASLHPVTTKTTAIRDWLARHPRFNLHFTPVGSSWISQVPR